MGRTFRVAVATLTISLLTLGAVACGSSSKDSSGGSSDAPVDYSARGPHPVGTVTLDMGGRKVYVYYPADPNQIEGHAEIDGYSSGDAFPAVLRALLPAQFVQQIHLDVVDAAPIATDAKFPIVVHSHGFGGYPEYAARHLSHLASWGFVTIAPDHTERDLAAVAMGTAVYGSNDVQVLRDALALVEHDARFAGSLDTSRIAAEGHSAGGAAAAKFAYDPEVTTFIGQAPAAPSEVGITKAMTDAQVLDSFGSMTPPNKPSMLLAGEKDGVIPLALVAAEEQWLATPKRFAVLANAGHNSFTDLCAPIRAQGGLSQFTSVLPVPTQLLTLGEDGCTSANADPATVSRVIDQLTVAQLRFVFGIDHTDASLSKAWLDQLFPGSLATYTYVP